MMNVFAYNSAILSSDRHKISVPDEDEVKILQFAAKEKNIEWFYNSLKNTSYPVEDKIDKNQELPNAKRREIVVVIGLNSIREIETIYGQMNPKSILIVCEPNPAFVLHALNHKDLKVFQNPNVALFACANEEMMYHFNITFCGWLLLLVGNMKFYTTHYYRDFEPQRAKEIIEAIALVVSSNRWGAGNSIEDCLEGSSQVMQNLKFMPRSKDVRLLKEKYKDVPCIIVSAGPSLEKNMQELHNVKDSAIIIATETILERLLKEGIVPHFVTSMERIMQAYEFSFKGKVIPPEVTLIAPPVIKPMIYDEYPGNYIIPMREGVREFIWWNDLLELGNDAYVMVGDSTAHLAFGFAIHTGANPIILMGQDLAYGDGKKDHASGTVYDKIGVNWQRDSMLEPSKTTEGYYGGEVVTNQVWTNFKKWFEMYALRFKDEKTIINATEGGAKIKGVLQMPLKEAIEKHCKEEFPIREILNATASYKIEAKVIKEKLVKAVKQLKQIRKTAETVIKNTDVTKIKEQLSHAELAKEHAKLKKADKMLEKLYGHMLLFHTVQPMIIHSFYRLYRIEETLTRENVIENMVIQRELAETVVFGIDELVGHMNETIKEIGQKKEAL
ncbi:motility associated factor glycosyltransferase family protein [Anaeroarcus burkinensis]|uniref:motility associated factor glycosyltransferase family protein n=1 Tax=Anaeroarcus burkinensis TaxID=82376 RepID=UPI00048416FB|nr:6-hydroxymethylpterin diphosphokinase MptE-like protein [Anaeroarcus burkinensis]